MKKILSFLFILSLFSSNICLSQSGWVAQTSGTTSRLNSVCFVNENFGCVAGNEGTILITTNSGNNWVSKISGTAVNLISVSFVNTMTGFVVGTTNGIILKTVNGGNNWIILSVGTNEYLSSVYLHDVNTGWVVGSVGTGGVILKTTNSGSNWITLYSGGSYGMGSVYFVNANTGYIGCHLGYILKTTNSGNNWSSSLLPYPITNYSIYFISENTGWFSGYWQIPNQVVYFVGKTTNGGLNWILQAYNGSLYDFSFVDNNTGWTAGYAGLILKTSNCGNNWLTQQSGTGENLRSIAFINYSTGWVVGTNGIILKTTTGGEPLGIKNIDNKIPLSFSLSQNYPNPFNPVTKIKYDIPTVGQRHAFDVRLIIYDILGREIETLVNESQKPGSYEVAWDGSRYASGVYFYKLITEEWTETKKMVLIK